MQVAILDDTGTTARMVLNGRLDIVGADVVALPLATLSGSKTSLIVDMADVSFLASIGIRHLVAATKALGRRGGKLILLNPNPIVTEVLTTSGVSSLMPIMRSDDEAQAALAG
ncbi:MAG: anti-sigma-factor antagonist [Xanthobacteraceae bacterium]|jgi:anti-anti-sigma factor|nr:anti-sigma-factor antagonist [Xanthobacteraceae bacterium]